MSGQPLRSMDEAFRHCLAIAEIVAMRQQEDRADDLAALWPQSTNEAIEMLAPLMSIAGVSLRKLAVEMDVTIPELVASLRDESLRREAEEGQE